MITTLANKYRISLKKSFMIGDGDRDILAGKRAGVKTILVKSPKIKDYKLNVKPNFKATNLWSAVKLVLRKYAVSVSSGTAALDIAIKSINIKKVKNNHPFKYYFDSQEQIKIDIQKNHIFLRQ